MVVEFLYWILIFGAAWAPLFTIFYWQYGATHRELDDSIRNKKEGAREYPKHFLFYFLGFQSDGLFRFRV
jgi:hypothetical protein